MSADVFTTDYLFYLATERQWAASSLNVTVCGLRSFYQLVLQRPLAPLKLSLPWTARAVRRPQVFEPEELERLFTVGGVPPKHRTFLMTGVTPVATGIVRSARAKRRIGGSNNRRPRSCRCPTSIWCSPCRTCSTR